MIRFMKFLVICMGALAIFLLSCKKDDKLFDFHRDWLVEQVSKAGVELPDHASVGDKYYFDKDDKCYITPKNTGKRETHTWEKGKELKFLYIDELRYEIYKAEGDVLEFGQVVEGVDVLTYHLRAKK